ncbi:AbiJ-related protein [Micromonospora chalcea]|uniref:AbiJ-related protein n=1 Tax=Micromonospora chalcea TaxID=1874 RepID=UPI003328D477
MGTSYDLGKLRELVGVAADRIAHAGTTRELVARLARVGLPDPAEGNTKSQLAASSVAVTPDERLPEIAQRILDNGIQPDLRNAIQDTLWAAEPAPDIPKRLRREIARDLDLEPYLPGYNRFKAMLHDLWDLSSDAFGSFFGNDTSLGGQIDQHVRRNPGDWTAEDLFEKLGAFDALNKRFARFLEGLVSGDVLLDESAQRTVVDSINLRLNRAGLRLSETGERDGYPVFHLMATRAHTGLIKNLFFASVGKPDLRISDLLENNIENVRDDRVLMYERPIAPADGLRWRDLETWWQETRGLGADEAKRTLWRRLTQSLPASSPPQRHLFELYHEIHGERVYDLPALLPEVWLHWDPLLLKERGAEAMVNLRMDFLMLLPRGHRIVLEVDGKQHYATGQLADPTAYATTMHADRDLKLARYDVFRFGAAELTDKQRARTILASFFTDLFRTYHLA